MQNLHAHKNATGSYYYLRPNESYTDARGGQKIKSNSG